MAFQHPIISTESLVTEQTTTGEQLESLPQRDNVRIELHFKKRKKTKIYLMSWISLVLWYNHWQLSTCKCWKLPKGEFWVLVKFCAGPVVCWIHMSVMMMIVSDAVARRSEIASLYLAFPPWSGNPLWSKVRVSSHLWTRCALSLWFKGEELCLSTVFMRYICLW